MLEIKTISNRNKAEFDEEVNAALREGWELVRRECLIVGADHSPVLYAELERIIPEVEIEEDESEEDEESITAEWTIIRDPLYPYKCTACGCKCHRAIKNCPQCRRIMLNAE